jgi:hypothetical protein
MGFDAFYIVIVQTEQLFQLLRNSVFRGHRHVKTQDMSDDGEVQPDAASFQMNGSETAAVPRVRRASVARSIRK